MVRRVLMHHSGGLQRRETTQAGYQESADRHTRSSLWPFLVDPLIAVQTRQAL
jgi:hypothetical protein